MAPEGRRVAWNPPGARRHTLTRFCRLPLVPILRRCGIQLPTVAIAFSDLVGAFQLLVVLILDADGAADVVHDVLVGRRVVPAGRFVADAVGRLPVGIDVAAGEGRARLGVLVVAFAQAAA